MATEIKDRVMASTTSGHPDLEVIWNGSMPDVLGTKGGLLPQRTRRTASPDWRPLSKD